MCNKAVDNYRKALEFVPDCSVVHCFRITKMRNKLVDIHPSVIQFVPEYLKTHRNMLKPLIIVLSYLVPFLIDKNLKRDVIKSFLKMILC